MVSIKEVFGNQSYKLRKFGMCFHSKRHFPTKKEYARILFMINPTNISRHTIPCQPVHGKACLESFYIGIKKVIPKKMKCIVKEVLQMTGQGNRKLSQASVQY